MHCAGNVVGKDNRKTATSEANATAMVDHMAASPNLANRICDQLGNCKSKRRQLQRTHKSAIPTVNNPRNIPEQWRVKWAA